jgi:hypothetical protein
MILSISARVVVRRNHSSIACLFTYPRIWHWLTLIEDS